MCCLVGIHDYGHKLNRKQKTQILSVLSIASEDRGTDATGIAYNVGGDLKIYKRPLPAHLRFPPTIMNNSGRSKSLKYVSIRFSGNASKSSVPKPHTKKGPQIIS